MIKKSLPKLSIITVCYNNKEGLRKTIESVKRQTFRNYEYIIIDGGSTDGTVDLIRENEGYIDYWISEKDNGIYNAMNKGIRIAKGEYCYFLNSDDRIAAPNTLEKVFKRAKNDADIIYGNLAIIKNQKLKKVMTFSSKLNLYSFYRHKVAIHHQASFIKKELFEKYGYYDEAIPIIADWYFYYKVVILNKVKTQYVNMVFSFFMIGGASYSCTPEEVLQVKKHKENILKENNSLLVHNKYMKKIKRRENNLFFILQKIKDRLHLILAYIRREI